MKRTTLFLIISAFFLTNCATMMKGYFDKVEIKNAPADLVIVDQNNIKIKTYADHSDTSKVKINLRSNSDHILTLKYKNQEKTIMMHRKIGFFWGFVDFISGVYPMFIDAYTGAWCHYDPIVIID
ncbi:MAG: hypothetical protein AB7T22_11035 [Calditrichaceae bacterium]